MKASVIIPVNNQKYRLKMVLKAFNNQNYDQEFEVVVIDDGSTDNVEEFIKDLSVNYNLKFKRLEKNSGRSISRNEGARNAKGDILIFCDADRIPCENFISEHVKTHLTNEDEKVVLGRIVELFLHNFEEKYDVYISNDKLEGLYKSARNFNYYDYIESFYDINGNTTVKNAWVTLFTSNFSITKELFDRIQGFDDDFTLWGFENFEFGYRLSQMNVNYMLNRKAENFHIFHKADRTGSRRNDSYKLFLHKHPCPEVKNLLDFLDGFISWQKFNLIALGADEKEIQEESFFKPSALGKRYRIG